MSLSNLVVELGNLQIRRLKCEHCLLSNINIYQQISVVTQVIKNFKSTGWPKHPSGWSVGRPKTIAVEGYSNGLAQDCSNSSALAKELLQSYTKPSIWDHQTENYQMCTAHFLNGPLNTETKWFNISFNSLWSIDVIRQHESVSTLAQLLASWLTAPKPLPKLMFTYHQWDPVTISWW